MTPKAYCESCGLMRDAEKHMRGTKNLPSVLTKKWVQKHCRRGEVSGCPVKYAAGVDICGLAEAMKRQREREAAS
jgi:hypothetical protein